ncbi:hypothetical protein ALP05_01956 [Pseudomonas caricapapayae]|uniref:Uncharacterized protein n=1 Tax=Pseudomonas caricapapayae TaxID=46678 RepID=A0A3M6EE14_9PSED|nr:hypothetical protein ALP05_01956 [Pseudomonas caricapapayae]
MCDAVRHESHSTLEREERQVSAGSLIVPMLRVGMQFWTLCVLS